MRGQMRLLVPGQPHAFFFETLEEQRHYTITLDGVDNADSRTGGFTTLKVRFSLAKHSPRERREPYLPPNNNFRTRIYLVVTNDRCLCPRRVFVANTKCPR